VLIKGPAAEIGLIGRIGLKNKDYDQTAVVTGNISSTLPIAGLGGRAGRRRGRAAVHASVQTAAETAWRGGIIASPAAGTIRPSNASRARTPPRRPPRFQTSRSKWDGKVAAIQMTSGHVVAENLSRGGQVAARGEGCRRRDRLPAGEFRVHRPARCRQAAVAEADGDGPGAAFLRETARELKLWILGGTINDPQRHRTRVANASLLIDADGKRVARYDKIHLFDVTIPGRDEQYRESTRDAGPRDRRGGYAGRAARDVGVLRHALSRSCTANSCRKGAEWLAMPAAFTVPTGRAHWETLLRARAIENLCYVVAPAQAGTHTSGRETYGDTLIVDYWGQVLSRLEKGSGVITADIDLAKQAETRARFPALENRQLGTARAARVLGMSAATRCSTSPRK
jgi:deaminated glutathione amidase